MSEQAPETPAGRGRTPSKRDGTFTRKIGPLPMWQWLLIALGMLAVYVIFSYRKKNQAANAANNTAAGAGTGGTTNASQVPQFVNQTYTTVLPPVVNTPPPNITINNPTGTPQPTPAPAPTPTPAPKPTDNDSGGGTRAVRVAWGGPSLNGMTLTAALQAIQQAGYKVNTISSGYKNLTATQIQAAQQAGRTVYSFTPYSNKTVNIGLM